MLVSLIFPAIHLTHLELLNIDREAEIGLKNELNLHVSEFLSSLEN